MLCSCVDLFTQVNFRKQKLENTSEDIELKIVKRPTSHCNPRVLEEIHVNEEQYTPRTATKQLNSAAAQTNIRLIEKVSPKGAELC